jgi:predicted RNA-binding Zn-ribbon protein involved in translation (DUF1610 family)
MALMAHVQQGGSVGIWIGIIVVLGIWGIAKLGAMKKTACMHCGHDNGRTGWQNQICPACGRNKTVFNSKKARKR